MTEKQKKRSVLVEWRDAACDSAWHSDSEGAQFSSVLVQTVGWVVQDDADLIAIAASLSEDGEQYNQTMTIPRGMVSTIKDIAL